VGVRGAVYLLPDLDHNRLPRPPIDAAGRRVPACLRALRKPPSGPRASGPHPLGEWVADRAAPREGGAAHRRDPGVAAPPRLYTFSRPGPCSPSPPCAPPPQRRLHRASQGGGVSDRVSDRPLSFVPCRRVAVLTVSSPLPVHHGDRLHVDLSHRESKNGARERCPPEALNPRPPTLFRTPHAYSNHPTPATPRPVPHGRAPA